MFSFGSFLASFSSPLAPAPSPALPFSPPLICCSALPSVCAASVPLTISTVTPVFTSVLPASLAAPTPVQGVLGAAWSLPVPAVVSLSLLTCLQLHLVLWVAVSTPAPSPLCPCSSVISGLLFRPLLSGVRAGRPAPPRGGLLTLDLSLTLGAVIPTGIFFLVLLSLLALELAVAF